jgi:hypothetical protein
VVAASPSLGVNTVTGEGLAQALAGAQVVVVYGSSQAIHIARELNPKLVIFARSSYLSGLPELRKAGADIVFSSEGEIALLEPRAAADPGRHERFLVS